MKKPMMILTAMLMALPVLSQTNATGQADGEPRHEYRKGDRDGGRRGERRDLTPEEREQMQERRLQMMEKTLKELGVTEEQKLQITELQNRMKEQMRAAYVKIEDEKKKLKALEDAGAPESDIFAAIDAVSLAQADQMKILARNRIQMERILGKEKFEQFMDKARNKWKEHGRRGGQGMPPHPNEQQKDQKPPIPQAPPMP